MLNSLYIKNYRNLKELKIDSLGQVNLITGKNNTGKSSILEAISIYATKGSGGFILQAQEKRGESFPPTDVAIDPNGLEKNIRSIASMFFNREIKFGIQNAIIIGENTDIEKLFAEDSYANLDTAIIINFVKYIEELRKDINGNTFTSPQIIDNPAEQLYDNKLGLVISATGNYSKFFPLDDNNFTNIFRRDISSNTAKIQFIMSGSIVRANNGILFDNIIKKNQEKYVIDALKIIGQNVEKIAFVMDESSVRKERIAVIKLSNHNEMIPLKSMGDGINRILTIILALINCENGYLLIDEFENGLHYSVQEKLWKIIFKLADELNIQVFATTHSRDCISSFSKVLNDSQYTVKGKLIRLDNINDTIKSVEFTTDELQVISEQYIEVR